MNNKSSITDRSFNPLLSKGKLKNFKRERLLKKFLKILIILRQKFKIN